MSDRLKELREKRGKLVTDMRAIVEKAAAEKRDMTSEEIVNHGKAFDEQDQLRQQIEVEERTQNVTRELTDHDAKRAEQLAREQRDRETATRPGSAAPGAAARQLGIEYPNGYNAEQDELAMKAFRRFLRGGDSAIGSGEGAKELRSLTERRTTLQAGDTAEGGALVAPMEFVARLIIFKNNLVFIRKKATVMRVNTGASLGAPSLDADIDDADWTNELATGNEDAGTKFGRRELYPHPLAKLIKISKRLLRISAMPVEQIVMERMAYKFGVSEEKGFLLGSGAQQPLGVFTASNDGIPTSRDVSTGNSTTAPTIDGLKNAKYSLKAAYWSSAEWIFHRDMVKTVSELKDGDGQYLWQTSVQNGEPDRLLGSPVNISEYAPNTFTTGQYVGIYGDFSNYWIADALDMQVQRLVELYAAANQDGFIGRQETDGMPVLAEAFARVKLA